MGEVPVQIRSNARLRAVHALYFGEGQTQAEIAKRFGVRQQAIAERVGTIRRLYVDAGMQPPPAPGRGLEVLSPVSLSTCFGV